MMMMIVIDVCWWEEGGLWDIYDNPPIVIGYGGELGGM